MKDLYAGITFITFGNIFVAESQTILTMKKVFSLLLLLSLFIAGKAQNILIPGDNSLEKKWIKNGKSEMGYYVPNGDKMTEICSFTIDVHYNNKTLSVYTALNFLNSNEQWVDTCVSDANTFHPVYRSSFSKNKAYVLNYGKDVTGYYYDKQTQKRNTIKETLKEPCFDNYTYPYLLGLLPLKAGYKKDLVVYDYNPDNTTNIKKTIIEEVKNNIYSSALSGEHKVWQVSVFEEATNDKYQYYIDKDTRRIWKIEISSKGQQLLLIDKELDFNPFTSTFDKEATLKLVKNGSAVISGVAFARDNQAAIKGIAILNVNKKQYAKTGTSIILIPYTDFFKEWIKVNESSRKKGRSIPLPKEAAECIKVATVYDNEGNFEFVNLMPGEYMVYTEFGYVHTASRREVIGYTDTYINGMFQGSYANTVTYNYNTNASAAVKKVVSIKKEGETVSVKLKKTL